MSKLRRSFYFDEVITASLWNDEHIKIDNVIYFINWAHNVVWTVNDMKMNIEIN